MHACHTNLYSHSCQPLLNGIQRFRRLDRIYILAIIFLTTAAMICGACQPIVELNDAATRQATDEARNGGTQMFINTQQAAAAASQEVARYPGRDPSMASAWENADLDEPVLVHDISGNPSYWLVPVNLDQGIVGFVRVMGTGQVAAVGQMGQTQSVASGNTASVTGVSAEEAIRMASEQIDTAAGETAADPIFVHDGPPGREAWLVEVSVNEKPTRWLFITQGGIYERVAGTGLDPDLE